MLPARPKLVIFDLDGTLLDTLDDIYLAVQRTLTAIGRPVPERAAVATMVGDGAGTLVARALGVSREDALVASVLERFLDFYDADPTPHTKPMPSVHALLDRLLTLQIPATVCTNKPRRIAEKVLARCLAGRVGALVAGGDTRELKPSPEPLRRLLETVGCLPGETWMVGDSPQDVQAARAAGMIAIGYLSNFGNQGRLRASQPDVLVEHFDQLLELLA